MLFYFFDTPPGSDLRFFSLSRRTTYIHTSYNSLKEKSKKHDITPFKKEYKNSNVDLLIVILIALNILVVEMLQGKSSWPTEWPFGNNKPTLQPDRSPVKDAEKQRHLSQSEQPISTGRREDQVGAVQQGVQSETWSGVNRTPSDTAEN